MPPFVGRAEADVIVLGGGPGGLAAAVASARAGARTLLVEADTQVGGNAVLSTGYLALLGTELQRQAGIDDDVGAFLADLVREAELQARLMPMVFDQQLATQFVEGTPGTVTFLADLGARFGRIVPRPAQHARGRMVSVVDTTVFGTGFAALLQEHSVEVALATRAVQLSRGPRGWEVSVVHATGGDLGTLTATRSVVLATGGYQGNPELRARYQLQTLSTRPHLGLETCRGDGHLMAAAAGADLLNMPAIPSLVIAASAFVEDAIAVNRAGERFHDETGPYEERVAALLAQPRERAFYLYDARTARSRAQLIQQMPEPPVTAATLAGLAGAIGSPADTLTATVVTWNRTVSAGGVPDAFGRLVLPESGLGILEPPFSAIPLVVGTQFTAGGCRVTTTMCAVDLWGRPIEGLYAVGDCVGGINPAAGVGGIHIASALTLGRTAGRAAAHGEHGVVTDLSTPGASSGGRSAHATLELVPLVGAAEDQGEGGSG